MSYASRLAQISCISLCLICLMMTLMENSGIILSTVEIRKFSLQPVPAVEGRQLDDSEQSRFNSRLAIIEVVSDRWKIDDYRTAVGSVQCYAGMKGHFMYLVDLTSFEFVCGHHQDFFYKRHCVTSYIMEKTDHDWYVFLDSDMEVVNPYRNFSEYIDNKHEILLYDRFWNWEIMAGSFIVKGSKFGKAFVRGFANFEFLHPKIADHGTDNGAIQAYVAEVVLGNREKIHDCWKIWEESKGWDNMFDHEWCVRKVLGAKEDLGQVKIFRKGTAWARDGGITQGKWSLDFDFILHGRKEQNKKTWPGKPGDYWFDTRTEPLDLKKCREGTAEWKFRNELLVNRTDIARNLKASAAGIVNFLRAVYGRINKTEVIVNDLKNQRDVIDHFSIFNDTESNL